MAYRWTHIEINQAMKRMGLKGAPSLAEYQALTSPTPSKYRNIPVVDATGAKHDAGKSVTFTLPWPPSVNHYWRSVIVRGRTRLLISKDGRKYRKSVAARLSLNSVPRGFVTGKLAVEIAASPPDRRARDLDNLLKSTLDALKHSCVIRDDADIDDLRIKRCSVLAGGELSVQITEVTR